ncbi:YceI family protein [Spirosoma aureum]|uniref:YceI family protein n=1 Tax=Spirosoma aureum TaxID=2692134 RepID=A0A6G9AUF5_9BACT|nr:YceI family protein [Spirosoma aureum]QIP15959.1 YceI family protein [Spirosoma aureum]
METKQLDIVSAQSQIEWIGRKVTGSHNGTIALKEGALFLNESDQLIGGTFRIDTTSIQILDIADPATNAQFAGHLASDDFFSSEKYPTATFEITSTDRTTDTTYHIQGDLTIKGITHPIDFDADVTTNSETVGASGKIVIDRTKFGMKFRSGNFFKDLGDTLIYNQIDLTVNLVANVAHETRPA